MTILIVITIYPFLYTLSVSLSQEAHVLNNDITFYPKGFNLEYYGLMLKDKVLLTGYWNNIIYTVIGTIMSVVITFMTAYPLSKKGLPLRNIITFMIAFTMFFSGGLIPSFVVVKSLGMYNSMWALIIPGIMGQWYMLLVRNFISHNIPESIEESAFIDGANEVTILIKIIVPLSIPIIAIMTLFYAIGYWNAYYPGMIYLRDVKKFPLQLVLRRILIESNLIDISNRATIADNPLDVSESLKDAVIMMAVIPVLVVYPFVQKHFVKGILVGSIKG
jgi:putative aldouronate transport system permease protein